MILSWLVGKALANFLNAAKLDNPNQSGLGNGKCSCFNSQCGGTASSKLAGTLAM
jgi:hypothetical protein